VFSDLNFYNLFKNKALALTQSEGFKLQDQSLKKLRIEDREDCMTARSLIIVLTLLAGTNLLQLEKSSAEKRIDEIIQAPPAERELRHDLLQGAPATRMHYAWMDKMRQQRIKRVIGTVEITFHKSGRPRKMAFARAEYFEQYEGKLPITDPKRLEAIRASGLEKELSMLALERARDGVWVDVPRPRPKPFAGGAQVEFLDDEALPVKPVMYFQN
jgi:hypothetical protein